LDSNAYLESQTVIQNQLESESQESVDIYHKPVFKLLKGFKLQQYAMVRKYYYCQM